MNENQELEKDPTEDSKSIIIPQREEFSRFKPISLYDNSKTISRQIIQEEDTQKNFSHNLGSQSQTLGTQRLADDMSMTPPLKPNLRKMQIQNHLKEINSRYKYNDQVKGGVVRQFSDKFLDFLTNKKIQDSESRKKHKLDQSTSGTGYLQYTQPAKKMVPILRPDDSSYKKIRNEALKASKGSLGSPFKRPVQNTREQLRESSDTLDSKID